MVRLVLFDIDGTLVRTGGAGVQAFAKVFATEFGATEGFERLKFSGRTDISLLREFFGFHNIPPTPDNFSRFFERYVFWLDEIMRGTQGHVCPGVVEFIHGLQGLAQPPSLGLLTGNIRLGAEIKLRHYQLWDYFVIGAFADDAEERAQIAAIACERGRQQLGEDLRGDQIVVIGDTPYDIQCARAVGAKVLAVATGGATYEDLLSHQPDWLADDLRAITPAEIVLGCARNLPLSAASKAAQKT